jgi:DNA-directed RNA polymerase specialized sigma24 family protein
MTHTNARSTDPETSRAAGAEIEANGTAEKQRITVARAVEQFPGLTARELAKASGLDFDMVHKRLSDARTVKRGPARPCSISTKTCVTWWLK